MPSLGTTIALAFYLAAMVISGIWLYATDRTTLRPVLTTTLLVAALAGYAATWIAVSRA
jgi:hypothetical protein